MSLHTLHVAAPSELPHDHVAGDEGHVVAVDAAEDLTAAGEVAGDGQRAGELITPLIQDEAQHPRSSVSLIDAGTRVGSRYVLTTASRQQGASHRAQHDQSSNPARLAFQPSTIRHRWRNIPVPSFGHFGIPWGVE